MSRRLHIDVFNAVLRDLSKQKKFAKRNFARQGKASAKPDGIVAYVEGDKSML